MNLRHPIAATVSLALVLEMALMPAAAGALVDGPKKSSPSMADLLLASPESDWQALDPKNTLYLDLPGGRVVIELAPDFAPAHVANVRSLATAGFFDGLSVVRVQDNYVAQWGDGESQHARGNFVAHVPTEYFRSTRGLPFTPLPDHDAYAARTGFSEGFPVARDATNQQTWLTHCYGMVGVGRDMPPDSGDGTELYAVIGHAPRHLDRNLAVVGRVVKGIELLSSLPRGTGALGFYEKDEQHVPITNAHLAADLPPDQRLALEALRTDSATFRALVELRRNRREGFFVEPTGHIDVCNVPLPVRAVPQTAP